MPHLACILLLLWWELGIGHKTYNTVEDMALLLTLKTTHGFPILAVTINRPHVIFWDEWRKDLSLPWLSISEQAQVL